MSKLISDVFVVVPIFNEEQVLQKTLTDLKKYFKNIIAINDGSLDKSREIVEKIKNIILINHSINAGQGLAISTGIKYLKSDTNAKAIITFDADGQHSVKDAVKFAKEIMKCKEEIIFGSRFIDGRDSVPIVKKLALILATKFTNLILKMKLSDSHNGMKAIKTSCLDKINFEINGFGFESELVYIISKYNIKYKEMKTNTKYTKYSIKKGQRLSNGLKIIEDLLMR